MLNEVVFSACSDRAVMDSEGYGYIVGRTKDMIVRGGENIYPLEVEQFLYTHPDVADVQVSPNPRHYTVPTNNSLFI